MPAGIPVATVALNGARNAGILAARIIAVGDPRLARRLQRFREEMQASVLKQARDLERRGHKKLPPKSRK